KPQKLMIVINPIGGKKIGRQLFEKLARPLFTLAGIELDVIVTERAGHATDIANNLNPSSIDGLVVVGGDGMYMEVMEPLLKKAQDEARVNVDNPNAQLAKPQVRIGILPAGTGNVVSGVINGIIDFETATLNVIRGETDRGGVFSIHEADTGALIHYSGLLIGYGLLGDILDRSQTLRWMKGRLRYAYVLLTKCFGRKRMYNIDVEVLREKPYGSDVEKQSGGKANSHATGWTRLGEKRLTTLMALTPHLDVEGEKMEADLFTDGFHSCLISSRSGFQLLSIMIGLMKQKRDTFNPNYTEVLTKIQGLRFKLNEEKGRRSSSHAHYISRALTVDGEMRTCSANEVPVLEVSWRDVVCACPAPTKKSWFANSKDHASSESRSFIIHFITKDRQSKKCRCDNVQLHTKDDSCDAWISQIEDKKKEGKPQKLLIIINPIGGKGTARQQFEKLVVVGGDGMYMEVLHPLVLKAQEEAGVNVDDPEAQLVRPPVMIGILPAGTGNGMSNMINGVIDFETAALNIIRDLMIAKVFGRKRVYDLDVEVLQDVPHESSVDEQVVDKVAMPSPEWTKLGVKHVTSLIAMTAHIDVEGEAEKMVFDPFTDGFHASLCSTQSGFDYVKMMFSIIRQRKDTFEHDYFEVLNKIKGLRFKLIEENGGELASGQTVDQHDVSRLLDVDGEAVRCSVPDIELRFHPHMIQMFSARDN
ncbi:hypothetical protein BaRGS_00012939, partial [Batillaria attramentaria]